MVNPEAQEKSLISWTLVSAVSVLALFLLLVVSEVAMTPPLLAPHSSPDPGFTGSWKGTAQVWLEQQQELHLVVDLSISPDGKVKGSIGQSRVTGQLEVNRSWLGRTLNLRTDYIIVGEVSGFVGHPTAHERFSMPLNFQGNYFKGSIFVGKRAPSRVSLFKFGRGQSWHSDTRFDVI